MPDETSSDGLDILKYVQRYLDDLDRDLADLASEEDFIIVSTLTQASTAAKQKGYSVDLLITCLRSIFGSPRLSS